MAPLSTVDPLVAPSNRTQFFAKKCRRRAGRPKRGWHPQREIVDPPLLKRETYLSISSNGSKNCGRVRSPSYVPNRTVQVKCEHRFSENENRYQKCHTEEWWSHVVEVVISYTRNIRKTEHLLFCLGSVPNFDSPVIRTCDKYFIMKQVPADLVDCHIVCVVSVEECRAVCLGTQMNLTLFRTN